MDNQENDMNDFPAGYHKSNSFGEASRHAWSGVWVAFATERNLRIQVIIYAVVLIVAILVQLSFLEMAMIILSATVVMALEMVNTAVEHFADVVEPRYSKVVGKIKDFTAGAVLLTSIAAAVVGLLLIVPPIVLRLVS